MIHLIKVPIIEDKWCIPETPVSKAKEVPFLSWDSVLDLNKLKLRYGNIEYFFVLDSEHFWMNTDIKVARYMNTVKAVKNSKFYTRIFNIRVVQHPFNDSLAAYFGDIFFEGNHYPIGSERLVSGERISGYGENRYERQYGRQYPKKENITWDMVSGLSHYQAFEQAKEIQIEMAGMPQKSHYYNIRYYEDNKLQYMGVDEIKDVVYRHFDDADLDRLTDWGGTVTFSLRRSEFCEKLFRILEDYANKRKILITVNTIAGVNLAYFDGRAILSSRTVEEIVKQAEEELALQLKKLEQKSKEIESLKLNESPNFYDYKPIKYERPEGDWQWNSIQNEIENLRKIWRRKNDE